MPMGQQGHLGKYLWLQNCGNNSRSHNIESQTFAILIADNYIYYNTSLKYSNNIVMATLSDCITVAETGLSDSYNYSGV